MNIKHENLLTPLLLNFCILFIVEYREIDIEGPTKSKGVKSRPGEAEEESSPDEIDETVDQEYFDQDLKNSIDNMNGGGKYLLMYLFCKIVC